MNTLNKLCDYGCEQEALYQFKNGRWCCSESSNSCNAVCEKRSKSLKGTRIGKDNPFYGMKHTEEHKEKLKINMLGSKNPCYRKNYTKEERELMSKLVSAAWEDKNLRTEARKRGMKNFQDERYLEKFIKGCCDKPNKHEKFLIGYLSRLNLSFKYIGNFKKWIGGKNPDFIDEKNRKIVEYFGRYWHPPEDEIDRISHFKNMVIKL